MASESEKPEAMNEGESQRFRRLFKNTSIYALGEIGLQVLTAIFTPLLTFYLAPAELGIWSLSLMLFTGFSTICGLALHGAVTRFYYDHEFDEPAKRRFQGTILSFLLLWSLSLCIAVTLAGPALFDALFTDLPFWPYGAFIVWMTFIGISGVVPKATWAAAERSKVFVSINLLGSATNLIGSLGLVMLTGLGVLGLFWGKTASLLVLAVPFAMYSIRHVGLAWDRGDLKAALQFSLPLVPHLLAHWVLGMSDRFIIDHHYGANGAIGADGLSAGLRAVGIYSAAYVFIDLVNMVAVAMNRAWVPQFTRAYDDESQRPFVARSITYLLLAVLSISTVLILLAPPVILTFFDSKYAEAADIAPILAMGGLFQGTYYIYVAGLFYFKKNLLIPVITLVSGGTNVALNLLWIPEYGLVGAAWATVIGYIVLALGVRWGCRRYTSLPFERQRLMRLIPTFALIAVTGYLLSGHFSLGVECLLKGGLLLTGPVLLYFLGFWRDDELRWFRQKLSLEK